jgi:hypothetical protein
VPVTDTTGGYCPMSLAFALADQGRGSEHDDPRDECRHKGIQQDFIQNFGHCNLPVAAPLRRSSRALQYLGQKVTMSCYELDNRSKWSPLLSYLMPFAPARSCVSVEGPRCGSPAAKKLSVQQPVRRPLRGPYGADKFAHFDTKNSVLTRIAPTFRGLLLLAIYLGSAFLTQL